MMNSSFTHRIQIEAFGTTFDYFIGLSSVPFLRSVFDSIVDQSVLFLLRKWEAGIQLVSKLKWVHSLSSSGWWTTKFPSTTIILVCHLFPYSLTSMVLLTVTSALQGHPIACCAWDSVARLLETAVLCLHRTIGHRQMTPQILRIPEKVHQTLSTMWVLSRQCSSNLLSA